jgi:cytidylate kinase
MSRERSGGAGAPARAASGATHDVIAIDGPAGAGKSSTAAGVARVLRFRHVDSGAFYRAAALLALRKALVGESGVRGDALARALGEARIESRTGRTADTLLLDGEDVGSLLRSPEVTEVVSRVAAEPAVRRVVNDKLRESARAGPVVVDGRDIGTAVFPEARLKVFLDASLVERARRRAGADRAPVDPETLARRDEMDQSRGADPLAQASDAVVLATDELTLEEQIARIVELYRRRVSGKEDETRAKGRRSR